MTDEAKRQQLIRELNKYFRLDAKSSPYIFWSLDRLSRYVTSVGFNRELDNKILEIGDFRRKVKDLADE